MFGFSRIDSTDLIKAYCPCVAQVASLPYSRMSTNQLKFSAFLFSLGGVALYSASMLCKNSSYDTLMKVGVVSSAILFSGLCSFFGAKGINKIYLHLKGEQKIDGVVAKSEINNRVSAKGTSLILRCHANSDWNGSFTGVEETLLGIENLENLSRAGFRLRRNIVSTSDEVAQAIEEAAENASPVTKILLEGHGKPQEIDFGDAFLRGDEPKFSAAIKKIDPHASIILRSCSTGADIDGLNIAQIISRHIPEGTVIAPKEDPYNFLLQVGRGQVDNVYVLFKSKCHQVITRVYQNGVLLPFKA